MYYVVYIKHHVLRTSSFIVFPLLLTICYLLFAILPARAETLSNDYYIIESKGINIVNNITPTPTPTLSVTKENPQSTLSFSLSPTLVDFGPLSATEPVVRSVTFNLYSSLGYNLLAIEDHEPKSQDKVIPDTTCDNGTCTQKLSSAWNNILTYGFGYTLKNDSSYKQFANTIKGDLPQPIIEELLSKETQGEIIYKINIPSGFDNGLYKNITQLIAVPNF